MQVALRTDGETRYGLERVRSLLSLDSRGLQRRPIVRQLRDAQRQATGAPALSLTDVEYLAAHLTPRAIAKAAAARIARQAQREEERKAVAARLLAANPSGGTRFSMARAALVRVAAGAAVEEIVDKRKLRGAARAEYLAQKRGGVKKP